MRRGCGGGRGSWRRALTVPGRRARAKTVFCTTVFGMMVPGRRPGARVSPAAVSGAGASAAQVNGRLSTSDSLSLCGSP